MVKGVSFQNLRDAGDPVEQAQAYAAAGADELAFLDISASVESRGTLIEMVERVADALFIPFTVGGGVRSVDDVRNLLRAGADKVSINTAALENPGLIADAAAKFGSQCIVVAIDAKRKPGDRGAWEVYSHGGRRPTGRDALGWAAQVFYAGAGEILLTSIDRDGTKLGFDLELLCAVSQVTNIPLIASGGAGCPEDFYDVLTAGKADAALAASVFHDRRISIAELKAYLGARGVPIREEK